MFICGNLGSISEGLFHNYSVPVAISCSRAAPSKGKQKTALRVPKEPRLCRTLERVGIVGSKFVCFFLQDVAAVEPLHLWFMEETKKKEKYLQINHFTLKITENKSRKYFCREEGLK